MCDGPGPQLQTGWMDLDVGATFSAASGEHHACFIHVSHFVSQSSSTRVGFSRGGIEEAVH